MNTLQLQCFLEVADQLNYARAAETLHLSQPAVTKKIKSLEDELQVRLFDRDTRHVRLTDAGRLFYPNALSLYSQEMNIRSSLLHIQSKKQYHLFIGSFGMEVHLFLDKVLQNLKKRLPNLKVDIIGAAFEPLNNALETHSMDIVIGEKELFESRRSTNWNNAAFYDHMADMPLVLALPPETKSDTKSCIPSEALSLENLTPEIMERYLPDTDRLTCLDLDNIISGTPAAGEMLRRFFDRTVTCDNIEAAFTLVRAGFGYMFLPESALLKRRDLLYLPIRNAPVFHYGCFYEKANENPALKILLEELHTYFDAW